MTNESTLPDFIGLDTEYPLADGGSRRRVHMDGAASPLACKAGLDAIRELLPHYSNTHSYVHASAQISSQALKWAMQEILDFVGADPLEYAAILTGAGTTAAINRLARGLSHWRPERPVVLVSALEHHANDLPHRQFGNEVHYIPLAGSGANQGAIDLQELERLLEKYADQVNYVAFSSVSNVTGIINPVKQITELAHKHGALVLVDAAQAVAHQPLELSAPERSVEADFVVFSGHKLYAPAAPGVLVARQELIGHMSGQDLGGGAVEDVSYHDFELSTDYSDKEQAGTPNIVGGVALARVMNRLADYGLSRVHKHAIELMNELQVALATLPHIRIYGDAGSPRIGALAINHEHIDHGLLAAILNDYYAIAVRNECFCAHPYVSSMLKEELWELDLDSIDADQQQAFINRKRGMVRVSLSLYNSSADIEALIQALIAIEENIAQLREQYEPQEDGSYRHKSFALDWQAQLGWS